MHTDKPKRDQRPAPFFMPGDAAHDPQIGALTFDPFDDIAFPPLLPEPVLRRHDAFVASDTRFAASARLLAALWRERNGYPADDFAHAPGPDGGPQTKAGWRLHREAAEAGSTFLAPQILAYARRALLFREPGSVWNEDRLWANLLSSQALTLNLLAPLAMDLDLATAVWRDILPGFVDSVNHVRFEHSPGRFEERFFGDGTAFDAIIDVRTLDGEHGVIAIEIKYIEDMLASAATARPRYDEASEDSALYINPASPTLARLGFEQLRREHVMTDLMLRHGLARRGRFVLIAPALNRRAQAVARLYSAELVDPDGDEPRRVGFTPITLERVISALANAGAAQFARELYGRYCDHHRGAQLALASAPPAPTLALEHWVGDQPKAPPASGMQPQASHRPSARQRRTTRARVRAAPARAAAGSDTAPENEA